jgi:hypothetical protein
MHEAGKPDARPARDKAGWLGAIATLVAALIGAWATMHARTQVIEVKNEQRVTLEEVARLRDQLAQRDAEIARLKRGPVAGTGTTDTDVTDSDDAVYAKGARAQHTEQGFNIRFYGCRRATNTVKCYFDVVNTQAERKFELEGYPGDDRYSRAFDDHGQQHTANVPEFAGLSSQQTTIPERLPVRAALVFATVPSSVTIFRDLKFVFGYNYELYTVDFRDVTIDT